MMVPEQLTMEASFDVESQRMLSPVKAAHAQKLLPPSEKGLQTPPLTPVQSPKAKGKKAEADPWAGREPMWDNLKGICVLLVVLIHTLRVFEQEVIAEGHFASGLILPLLFVVIPAFTFASGYLSQIANTRKRNVALFRMWAVFILQQLLYAAYWYQRITPREQWGLKPFTFWEQPVPGVTWFMLCLAVWRTALPLLDMLRWPVATTMAVSMLSMLTDTGSNAFVQCLFTFLPFYMAGYRHQKGVIERSSKAVARRAFYAVLVICPTLSLLLPRVPGFEGVFDAISRSAWTFYGCMYGGRVGNSLAQGGAVCHDGTGPLGALVYFGVAMLLMHAFFAVVPRGVVWGLSRAGAMSVYIYLFHIYFLVIGKEVLLASLSEQGSAAFHAFLATRLAVPACIALAVFVWGCLAIGWIRVLCHPIVEPPVELLLTIPDAVGKADDMPRAETA